MKDEQCVEFLRWALPRLGFRWEGFRKVRGQVCQRITGRFQELDIRSVHEYQKYLQTHPDEWDQLYSYCYATVSKFYRDRRVFNILAHQILPELARTKQGADETVRIWSAGSCSGEEPYTVSILWQEEIEEKCASPPDLEIVATDFRENLIQRAKRGEYPPSSLKELPDHLAEKAFDMQDNHYRLKTRYREPVSFLRQDIREERPPGKFALILCRNLVFTYFDHANQKELLEKIESRLQPGGYVIIGEHETLPDTAGLNRHRQSECIYRKEAVA